jgi:ribosome-associated protein
MIRVTPDIAVHERDIREHFIRAAGPGGQNVNKVSTAVQLRYDVTGADLPGDVRQRLMRLAGRRLTRDGVLVIEARRFRTRERNREDARDRLVALVRRAAQAPRPRRPTRPSAASKARLAEAKRRRARLKRQRGPVRDNDV